MPEGVLYVSLHNGVSQKGESSLNIQVKRPYAQNVNIFKKLGKASNMKSFGAQVNIQVARGKHGSSKMDNFLPSNCFKSPGILRIFLCKLTCLVDLLVWALS